MTESLKLVVAGATGALGQHVVDSAKKAGWQVTVLGRDQSRLEQLGALETIVVSNLCKPVRVLPLLIEALQGNDCVFSSLGASVQPSGAGGSRTYSRVDTPCNRTLIEAAKRANVAKFVYVSVAGAASLGHLDYVAAHEKVVQTLAKSGLDYAVVRPTGFFSAFATVLKMANKGTVPLMGLPDQARTNPIDDAELAEICLNAIASDFGEQEVGGPEIMTRRQLVDKAFDAVGKPAKTRDVPAWLVRFMSAIIKPFNPRLANIAQFYLAVSSTDCIAPQQGSRRISDYFAEYVRANPL